MKGVSLIVSATTLALIAAPLAVADDERAPALLIPADPPVERLDDGLSAAEPTQDIAAMLDFRIPDIEPPSLEWHGRFTLRSETAVAAEPDVVEFSAGRRWSFTLGISSGDEPVFDLEGVEAGAFFNLTPRMRIGGALSFGEADDPLSPGADPIVEDAPEVKLESAFRF